MKKFALVVGFVVFFGSFWIQSSFGQTLSQTLPKPIQEELPNGLKIAWFVDNRLPLIDIALLVRSGSRDNPKGKAGTALLLSNVLERGSAGKTATQIAHEIEKLGASRSIGLDDDAFTVGMSGLSENSETLLKLLSQTILLPNLALSDVERERVRILQSWQHLRDSGQSLATLAFHRLITSGTTYARGDYYGAKELKRVTREDLIQFHKIHFSPKNSVLMVVGRVDPKKFKPKVIASLGHWLGQVPKRNYRNYTNTEVLPRKAKVVVVDRRDLTQAQVRIGFNGPRAQAKEHYDLVVANTLFGEYFDSWLNSVVRDKLALTYATRSYFTYSKNFRTFLISSSTRNETTGTLIQTSLDLLKKLQQGKISQEEVDKAKGYLVGSFPVRMSSTHAVASRWLGGHLLGFDAEYLNEYIQRVKKVNLASVRSAIKKYMATKKVNIVVAGDWKAIRKSLKEAKLLPAKKLKAEDLL